MKNFYDGYHFGRARSVYNPTSVTAFLDRGGDGSFLAGISANTGVETLMRKSDPEWKAQFARLFQGESFTCTLGENADASGDEFSAEDAWRLFESYGYMKVVSHQRPVSMGPEVYTLALANEEVRAMFCRMIFKWFSGNDELAQFVKAMPRRDTREMCYALQKMMFSAGKLFDGAENFAHALALGLMVYLCDDVLVKTGWDRGDGKCEITLEPKKPGIPGVDLSIWTSGDECGKAGEQALRQARAIQMGEDGILRYDIALQGNQCQVLMAE
ncbi:MAG: hypothetical protein IJ083_05895 [Clostridia bacterium]|nr:hypothetical protein [Clostridia bacterium]